MFCRECGNKIGEGTRFCTRCGTPTGPVAELPLPEKKRTLLPWILCGVGVLTIVVVAVAFFAVFLQGAKETDGYDSEDELIMAFIQTVNGELDMDEFCRSFDAVTCLATAIADKSNDYSYEEVCRRISDSETGADFVVENYSDICMDILNRSLKKEDIISLKRGEGELYHAIVSHYAGLVREFSEKYEPLAETIDNNAKSSSAFGMTYKIEIRHKNSINDESDCWKIYMNYISRDGKYYWNHLNYFVQARGG